MDNQEHSLFELELDQNSTHALQDGARWARFVSIVFIVLLAFALLCLVAASFFVTDTLNRFSIVVPLLSSSTVLYSIIAVVIIAVLLMLYAYFQLYRFADLTKDGINAGDQQKLESGVRHLRLFMKILALTGMIGLAISIASLVVNIIKP